MRDPPAEEGRRWLRQAEADLHWARHLAEEAGKRDATFGPRLEEWGVLDGYYVPTRYPNSVPGGIPADVYTRSAAKAAVALAEEVVEAVRERL